jgi:hypothetical protein
MEFRALSTVLYFNNQKAAFRKLDLFPSSGEGRDIPVLLSFKFCTKNFETAESQDFHIKNSAIFASLMRAVSYFEERTSAKGVWHSAQGTSRP